MQKLTALAVPTAMLASACADPMMLAPLAPPAVPQVETRDPPSIAAYDWSAVPPPRPMTVPSSSEVAAWWMLTARNPWAPFQKATLLAALEAAECPRELPDVEQLDEVKRARAAAEQLAQEGLPEGTMWVVDLRGAASVAFGAALSDKSQTPVSAVMTFHNWPATNETVPAEETLSALATMHPRQPKGSDGGSPVFMLDAWRLTHRYDRPDQEATDNRYMLTPSDLPLPELLQTHNIRRVIYVVDSLDDSQAEEDDLHEIFATYQKAGIDVAISDLAELTAIAQARPAMPYYGQTLVIDPARPLLVDDPSFYHRARGGFGGTNVIYSVNFGLSGAYGPYVYHGGG
jgi:hypothetical protein